MVCPKQQPVTYAPTGNKSMAVGRCECGRTDVYDGLEISVVLEVNQTTLLLPRPTNSCIDFKHHWFVSAWHWETIESFWRTGFSFKVELRVHVHAHTGRTAVSRVFMFATYLKPFKDLFYLTETKTKPVLLIFHISLFYWCLTVSILLFCLHGFILIVKCLGLNVWKICNLTGNR